MKKVIGALKDYPPLVTCLLALAVVAHWAFYDVTSIFPDVATAMADFSDAWSIYIAFAAVVAISAGFTGVILVFALGSPSTSFSRMRYEGGERLEANWVSPVATSLLAAFGSAICAVLWVVDLGELAWWFFEFLLLLALISGIRLLWLLRRLVSVVSQDDQKAHQIRTAPRSLEAIQQNRRDAG